MIPVLCRESSEIGKAISKCDFGDVADGQILAELCVDHLQFELTNVYGRCHAKLGRIGGAEHAFDAAIAEATRVGRTYHEMLAICDYTQAVLDQAGRRGEQLPALGRAIKALVLDPSEYTDILSGYGLDVNDAVAAAGEAST